MRFLLLATTASVMLFAAAALSVGFWPAALVVLAGSIFLYIELRCG